MDHNQLEVISSNEIAPFSSHMTHLDLSCNRLVAVEGFGAMMNLQELKLANNQLSDLPDLSRCKKVQLIIHSWKIHKVSVDNTILLACKYACEALPSNKFNYSYDGHLPPMLTNIACHSICNTIVVRLVYNVPLSFHSSPSLMSHQTH